VLGTIHAHGLASEDRLAVARTHFIETREKDFAVEGDTWRHRGDPATTYEVVRCDPLHGHDAESSGVTCFVGSGDRLLFLRRTGWQPLPREPEVVGEMQPHLPSREQGAAARQHRRLQGAVRRRGLVPGGIVRDGGSVKRRPWWETYPRELWAHEDWIGFYVKTGHMTREERSRLKIAGADDTPVELLTPDEKRWVGEPSRYSQS
jgi:hypothetical protein